MYDENGELVGEFGYEDFYYDPNLDRMTSSVKV